jgi:hypothetical protein
MEERKEKRRRKKEDIRGEKSKEEVIVVDRLDCQSIALLYIAERLGVCGRAIVLDCLVCMRCIWMWHGGRVGLWDCCVGVDVMPLQLAGHPRHVESTVQCTVHSTQYTVHST